MRIFQGRHRAKYQSFQEINDAHLKEDTTLVDTNFGKATVNCCLRGKHSLWGKYGSDQAAILYILIVPGQSNQWKLDKFELKLSFIENDPSPQSADQTKVLPPVTIQSPLPPTPSPTQSQLQSLQPVSQISKPLVLLERPAPRYINGAGTVQHLSTEEDYSAEVPTPAGSVRTPGYKRTKEKDLVNRWHWKSYWVSVQRKFTQAKWEWQANVDNPIIEDVGDLYAGLILRHANKPFWVECEVQGNLASGRKRLMYGHDKNRKPEITRVITDNATTDLQKEADELDKKMGDLTFAAAARTYNPSS